MDESKKVATTTTGAIGLGAIASFIGLCCIGPWVVVLFGVPGAVVLAGWQPYRLYIIAAAAGLLAWAFWRVYRPKPVCEDGTCPTQPSSWLKASLWAATALLVLAFFAEELQWILVDPTPAGLQQ